MSGGSLDFGNEHQESIRSQCLHSSGAFVPFEDEVIERSIVHRFAQQVRAYPDRIAVVTDARRLSYAELNAAANRVALECVESVGAAEEPVGVLLPKDATLFPAIFGALKANKVYVPLDPSLPVQRLGYIVNDAKPSLLITDSQHLAQARAITEDGCPLLNLDELSSADAADDLDPSSHPSSPAWIVYTSGSTGAPKGVVQTHRNVLHYVMNYTNYFHISPEDRFTLLFPFSVNAACHDVFASLLNGASLVPYDVPRYGIAALSDWMERRKITIYCSVPSVFRSFVSGLAGDKVFTAARLVRLIGEPMYKKDVSAFRRHFPSTCTLVNRLGSTETGSMLFYFIDHETPIEGNNVPVGLPVYENEILLLDEKGGPVTEGGVGEIAVKSRYLSPGYLGRPDLTRKVFTDSPDGDERIYRTGDLGKWLDDGRLVCLGRKDFQVKIRGHRVELSEIELALEELDSVSAAIVMARHRRNGEARLVAYLVAASASAPTVTSLRRELERKLPAYMVPATFVMLESFPHAPNGKIDRRALPDPGNARPELDTPFAPPSSPVEQALTEVWSDVLEIDRIGVDDSFLDLGGDSLLASQVMSRVRNAFDLEIPMSTVFRSSTVRELGIAIVETLLKEDQSEQTR